MKKRSSGPFWLAAAATLLFLSPMPPQNQSSLAQAPTPSPSSPSDLAKIEIEDESSVLYKVGDDWLMVKADETRRSDVTIRVESDSGEDPLVWANMIIKETRNGIELETMVANSAVVTKALDPNGDVVFGVTAKYDGTYLIKVVTYVPGRGLQEKTYHKDIGNVPTPPGPEPGPGPGPGPEPSPVPADEFDNIGQRVSQWTAGLAKRAEIGGAYKSVATEMLSGSIISINEGGAKLQELRSKIIGADTKWDEAGKKLTDDLKSRFDAGWDKEKLAKYYLAVAAGLTN